VEKERVEGAVIEEPEEVPQSTWVLVGQFFVVPVVIVALCVGIFVLFGLITGDARNARDYLEEVRAGKGNRRWQAAFELSKYLNQKGTKDREPRLAQDISSAFRKGKDDDPRVRQYLALAMGTLRDGVAVEPLVEAFDDISPEVRLYAVWALGEIRDGRAVEPLLKVVETSDHDLRKMTIYSLGLIQDPRALPSLQAALNDNHQDVRWNAALALARFHDASGVEILHQMLDRKSLNASAEINEQQKSDAIINAARAVALLKDSAARPLLEELKANDPDLKVRSAAIEALKEIDAAGGSDPRKKVGSP